MNNIKRIGSIIAIILILVFGIMRRNSNNSKQINTSAQQSQISRVQPNATADIEQLTRQSVVVLYIKAHGKLPDCYVTKKEAMAAGWNPSSGNLCDVLPGKAIGGDVFENRERQLPYQKGRKWFEADLNFSCGRRQTDRVIFSSDGLVYVTTDHYQTFTQQ